MSVAVELSGETNKLFTILHDSWRLSSRILTNRGHHFDPPSFGKRLRQAFANAKNADIARKLGVSESAASNYLAGRVPDAETLLKIKTITNCNLDWLLSGAGDRFESLPDEPPNLLQLLDERIRQVVQEEFKRAIKLPGQEEAKGQGTPKPIMVIGAGASFGDGEPQDLGDIDSFLEERVKARNNALLVLQDWYAHDNLPVPEISSLSFHGWDKMTLEQKVNQVRAVRESIEEERDFEAQRNAHISKTPRSIKKKI